MYSNWKNSYGDPQWFIDARFGMFIHFGLYSVAARHEWVMTLEEIKGEDYRKYYENFNPDLLDAKNWAKLAKESGFKYVVFTTKHHDGFVLWNTKTTEYKVTNTPYKKDILKEVVDAFRAEGIKIGFYYSLLDWNHKDFIIDGYHPDRSRVDQKIESKKDMKNYQKYMRDQLTELLTDYGKVDYLWFDFSYQSKIWGDLVGKGKDDWDSEKLEKTVFDLQPEIILNDRLDLKRGVSTHEQYQRSKDNNNEKFVWEGCQTLNGSWGYHRDNDNFKSSETIVKLLVDTVSKDGNLLLNIGPNGRGEIDKKSIEILTDVGEWMRLNSNSIYNNCGPNDIIAPPDCRYTINGNKLYLHIFSWPYRTITLKNISKKVKFAQFLHDHSDLKVIEAIVLNTARKDEIDLNNEIKALHIKEKLDEKTIIIEIPVKAPNILVPVIEITFE
ncbi:MAG: alpha-L-fucosidase [Spirochaetota bacterium]|nr:alpha-L-fucosidase [Spirochaetota bacterium]